MSDNFKFKVSLEVLNHLGRGLYRSFSTIIAESVSNSWDADATEVRIYFNKDENSLIVEDNGKGMDVNDFQNKFLKIGYARRKDPDNTSNRPVLGRKGIGKLALLSISEKITIISRKKGEKITGGIIVNKDLDNAIEEGKGTQEYSLGEIDDKQNLTYDNGTKIIFKGLKHRVESEDKIRRNLATQFNFVFQLKDSLDSFEIFVNDSLISQEDLKELNEKTQFLWFIGEKIESISGRFKNLKHEPQLIKHNKITFENKNYFMRGFIASTEKPGNLVLRGSEESFKASINLFANGRLRQENIFEEITSKRVVENYLYGEIYFDDLDDGNFY